MKELINLLVNIYFRDTKGDDLMLFYLGFTALIVALHYGLSRMNLKIGKIKDVPLAISMLLLGLLMGLRGTSVGTDTYMYGNIYNWYKFYDLNTALSDTKSIGWSFYVYILSRMGINYHGYLFISSIIMCFLMYKIISYFFQKNNSCFAVALFLLMYTYFQMFNTFRYHIAIVLLIYGLIKLFQKKRIQYLIFTLLAISFHSTMIIGLVFIPIYIISKHSHSKMNLLLWILIFTVGMFGIDIFINFFIKIFPQYGSYLSTSNETLSSTNNGRTIILRIVELAIGMFFFCMMKKQSNPIEKFLIFNLIFANIVGAIFYKRTLMVRLDSIFLFMDFISIAYFAKKIEFNKDKLIIKGGLAIAFSILLIIMLKGNYGSIIPYTF